MGKIRNLNKTLRSLNFKPIVKCKLCTIVLLLWRGAGLDVRAMDTLDYRGLTGCQVHQAYLDRLDHRGSQDQLDVREYLGYLDEWAAWKCS
uniref:Uncharacterized protein LOC108051014 isoform X2 n=1 Tax=Drosophila rhopaloa TaxID=1041015 RepID=A0A6P4FEP1_DRORH